jgi:hypothetical protein
MAREHPTLVEAARNAAWFFLAFELMVWAFLCEVYVVIEAVTR